MNGVTKKQKSNYQGEAIAIRSLEPSIYWKSEGSPLHLLEDKRSPKSQGEEVAAHLSEREQQVMR